MMESKVIPKSTMIEGAEGNTYALNPFAATQNINETLSQFCSHCNLTFVDNTEFEHHSVEMHGHKKKLYCELCHAIFQRRDHLKRHVQSMHHKKYYCQCPVCGKDFKRQDILLCHIKKKHSEKSEIFKCRECEFQCGSLTTLEQHETAHLLTDRHICPHCSTSFKRRDHMLRHVKSQHLNQSVLCPICGQTYKRKDHVVRHVREKHKMGLLNGKLIKSTDILE